MTLPPADFLVTTDEAAEWVGRSVRTVQSWSARGLLRPVQLGVGRGHQNRFRLADVLLCERLMRQRSAMWRNPV